jgi:hypothetical protein
MKNRSNYPPDWETISLRIRFERAKGRCEACGRHHGGLYWNGKRFVQVILTTAHLGIPKPDGQPGSKADVMDCRDENLMALCAACHLVFDAEQHEQTKQTTRRRILEAAKQLSFSFWSDQ